MRRINETSRQLNAADKIQVDGMNDSCVGDELGCLSATSLELIGQIKETRCILNSQQNQHGTQLGHRACQAVHATETLGVVRKIGRSNEEDSDWQRTQD
jgi:hypothetical protein